MMCDVLRRYEGSWMEDQKEGPGTYFFVATGKMYEGEWALGVAKVGLNTCCR